jgi:tetratricopeptide (TPR) repeat protein
MVNHKRKIAQLFIVVIALSLVQLSCSRKSDSWTSRTYHKMTSKFNPYFNGEESYKEGVATVEQNHKDNYEEILEVYQWGTIDQATSVAPQMDRAIEKSVKVIQSHSMMVSGKQKNVYVIKSYMLMGKARFYKHDFFPSLETFNYVIQQFSKDKKAEELVAEAQLWAGRCQLMIGNPLSAETYFDEIYNDKRVGKRLRSDISASRAQMFIDNKDYEMAVLSLQEAIKEGAKKADRIRWTFIMAQLHERLENNYEASRDYKLVIDMKPADYDMLFTAQLNRAKNFDVYMENPGIVYKELEKMLKDEKNIEYRDQIYYVMAGVALAEEEFEKAEDYLKKSIRSSKNNNVQKGLSYLLIADINFDFKDYVPAQFYYDSASTTLPQKHKKYPFAKKRAESLAGLVKNINIINEEDSLQRLAGMTESQQRKLFERYIENLKQEEERQRREQELRELNQQLAAQSQNMAGGPNVGSRQGWYFYNANTRASGIAAFQSYWGTRELEDNWRQKNKQTRAVNTIASTDSSSQEQSSEGLADRYNPEFYMAQIPKTQEDIDSSNARIQKAYVELGDIYKQQLADFKQSAASYNTLLDRYPACPYEPRVLFSAYRLYMDDKKEEKAEPYKQKLIDTYPTSVYTKLILEPDKMNKNDEGYKKIAALYQSEFDLYGKGKYRSVLNDLDKHNEVYAGSLLEPKFELLRCMCLGKLKQDEEFIAALKELVKTYPNTPEQKAAQDILNLIDVPEQTASAEGGSGTGNFAYESNVPHKFVAIVPNNGVDINTLRNEFANFNQQYFKLERLQMQNIFFDKNRQMIVISGLKNVAKAKVYYKSVASNKTLMGYMPQSAITRIIISDKNYRDLYRDKNLSEYLNFQKEKYQIEDSL